MSLPAPLPIAGLILAGGLARRMGGQDKGLLFLAGMPLVGHVRARLAPQVAEVFISANRNLARYATYGQVVSDLSEGFPGPLAGIEAGLQAAAPRHPWLLCVPCDAPYLPLDLAQGLFSATQAQACPIAIAEAGGRAQPVFMLLHRDLAGALGDYLRRGERRVFGWAQAMGACQVQFPDSSAFANLNDPGALQSAG